MSFGLSEEYDALTSRQTRLALHELCGMEGGQDLVLGRPPMYRGALEVGHRCACSSEDV